MISWSCRLVHRFNLCNLKPCGRFVHQTAVPNQFDCDLVHVQLRNHLLSIQLENVKRRNALNLRMYARLYEILQFAQQNQQVKSVLVTGSNGAYCSGNDLSFLKSRPFEEWPDLTLETIEHMDKFIGALIDLRKPLVAAVDGPAVGIGCSTLGLFDLIMTSDRSTFWTPFSKIALVAEGCSSFTFPKLLGMQRASQMILFNHKLTPEQACQWGFAHQMWPTSDNTFQKNLIELEQVLISGDLRPLGFNSLYKRIPRDDHTRRQLHQRNDKEANFLRQAWLSQEYRQYLRSFFGR